MSKTYKDLPLASVTIKEGDTTIVCPYCGETHIHGRPSKVGIPEHRLSHCISDVNPGYYIVEEPS
jgi:hypothetical protein